MSKTDWSSDLYQYLNDNATTESFRRSVQYTPELVKKGESHTVMNCVNSENIIYLIEVWIDDQLEIHSTCSCPYSGKGICKHTIASIRKIVKDNLLDVTKVASSYNTFITCDNGALNQDSIKSIQFNQSRVGSYYHNPCEVNKITRKVIKGDFRDYSNRYELELKYDKKKDQAELSCSCDIRNACSHKIKFLQHVLDKFGAHYFSDDFVELTKRNFLKGTDLLGKVDYDKAFELEISTSGIKHSEKLVNLLSPDASLASFKEDDRTYFIPQNDNRPKYATALCFYLSNNSLENVLPIYGKLNKAQTKISSKLNVVYSETLTKVLDFIQDKKGYEFLVSAVKLCQTFDSNFGKIKTKEAFRQIIDDFNNLLPYLNDFSMYTFNEVKGNFIASNLQPLQLSDAEFNPIAKIDEQEEFISVEFLLEINKKRHKIDQGNILVSPLGIFFNDLLYPFRSAKEAYFMIFARKKVKLHTLKSTEEDFRKRIIEPLLDVFELDYKKLKQVKSTNKTPQIEKQIYLSDEEGEYLVLQPIVKYNDQLISVDSKEKIWAKENSFEFTERNVKEEEAFLALVKNLHPNFSQQQAYFYLSSEQALESMWIMNAIEELQKHDVKVLGLNNLKSTRYNLNKPSFSMNVSSGTDWFDMNIELSYGDQKVDLKQLQKAIVKQQDYVELKDGTIGLLPKEWIEKYKKYFKFGQVKKGKIEISNFQFNIIDELYEELTNTPKFLEELYEKKKRLLNLSDLRKVRKPKGLKASLRSYQKEGLNWMVFLHENKLGGCLADDMGLGKTIQTIAFLLYLKNESKKKQAPNLIVAPTSLMFNWQAEIDKFAPSLKTLVYTGVNRKELRSCFEEQDVILTTYGSLIKDISFHKQNVYNYIILDESQAIKNPQSQRFKAVRILQCANRLALTGTPIENNTFDLYSQFNFLNPGIFGSVKHFRSTFSDAIDKEQDADVSELLSRMIAPFILRRTKAQVATELPAKTEAVIYCEMGKAQRKVYETFKTYFRQQITAQIENEGVNKSQMYILQGLTKLRQICNSTALADKAKDYGNDSAKLDELIHHLKDKVTNHKVLVFSQFVGMLSLVKERLQQENILFEYLDGQTSNREQRVNEFQNNDDIRVFLISLKAGGTGLNLTQAEYVYLIDPWWNPAVESQAIDRCYRIGQDKKVMAYRMICKDTIEEKIVKLQDKKKTIASEVIRVDKEKKTFSKDDVVRFFG